MANEKILTLDHLTAIKQYVDAKDMVSIKSADYVDNTITFYSTTDKTGEAVATFNLPEEMFLDQTKTEFVESFTWSETTYPDSANPNLDGKPVMVLAVKGDESTQYSFVSLDILSAKVSAETGNSLVIKSDGFYVPEVELTYATNEEVQAIFS